MHQSKLFYKTFKEASKEAKTISHKFLLRAGFISKVGSGVYNFLTLGNRVQQKIARIIREEMNKIGGQEIFLAALQPKELWQKTDRWQKMEPPLFKLKDIHKKDLCLGPTHEEVITDLAKSYIQSYKDLPFYLYQIQTKFRNEMRPTGGLLRTREFLMKDLYSFHSSQADLEKYFDKVLRAYFRIFKRCSLEAIKSEAGGGAFTEKGAKTFEFQVPAEAGEDKVIFCPKCKWAANLGVSKRKKGQSCPKCKAKLKKINAIEVGHVFSLGTKYSKAFGLYFLDEKGKKKLVTMGCYGIGLGRLMAAVVEVHHDEKGICWPKEITPFLVHLIPIESTKRVKGAAEKLYQDLQNRGIEVLYDDRENVSAGQKFAEADLIGIPLRLVVSEKTLEKKSVEIKKRSEKKTRLVKIRNTKFEILNKFQ